MCGRQAERPASPRARDDDKQQQYHALARQSFTRIRPDHPDTCYGDTVAPAAPPTGSETKKA